jgi:hypothetical protein
MCVKQRKRVSERKRGGKRKKERGKRKKERGRERDGDSGKKERER